jgi:PAS domain S-box-containing protein
MVVPIRKLIDSVPTPELRERREGGPEIFLYKIVDACASSVAVLNEIGTILHVNRAWRQFASQHNLLVYGYGVGFNYVQSCTDCWEMSVEKTTAIKKGIQRILDGEETEVHEEFALHSPTGQRLFVMRAARIDLLGSKGAFRILVTHEEISSNTETEAWSNNEERLCRLLETANIMPWEADVRSWCFTYVGGQAVRTLGYPLEEWRAPDFWTSHIHADDREYAISVCKKYSEVLDHFEFEYRMIALDGRIVWIHDLVSVIREGGKPVTLRGFMIDITERKRSEEALRDLSGRLITAQEEERSRVARELHDDLNQKLAMLSIELEQLGQKIPSRQKQLRTGIRDLWSRTQEISSEVHRLSYQLHPSKLDHLGLAAAVKSLCCELAEHHKVQIDFRHRGLPAVLAKEVTLCLFRVVQESLNNVIKHSGSREAKVVLEGTGKAVLLRVTDDGCGFDESAQMRGLGFISMRERLRLVGGEISVHSQPSFGTQINVSIPLVEITKLSVSRC